MRTQNFTTASPRPIDCADHRRTPTDIQRRSAVPPGAVMALARRFETQFVAALLAMPAAGRER